MIGRKNFSLIANATSLKNANAIALSLVLIGGLVVFGTGKPAAGQEMVMPIGDIAENSELNWYWDDRTGQLAARLDSQIIITSATDGGVIEGKITANGSNYTLNMYDDESVIMAQFGYKSGFRGDSYMAAKPSNGVFTIDIPSEYADADYVKLWVNGNSFVIQPPEEEVEDSTEVSAEGESEEDSTTITSTANSTTTTTTITKTVETDPMTNSTIITITTVTEMTPTEESEATNSTTITTVTVTTVDPSGTATSTTTTTTTTEPIPEESEEPAYVIGGNMTITGLPVNVPQDSDYWVADYITLFFEQDYFMLDRLPIVSGEYEDIDDYEDNNKAEHTEIYQTQIHVTVNSATLTYDL